MLNKLIKLFKDDKDNESKIILPEGPLKINKDNYKDLIKIFAYSNKESIFEELNNFTHDDHIKEECYWFIPTIVFHSLFPQVKKAEPDKFIILDDHDNHKALSFSGNKTYNQLEFWINNGIKSLDKNILGKVLFHSREFEMMNDEIGKGLELHQIYVVSIYRSKYKTS